MYVNIVPGLVIEYSCFMAYSKRNNKRYKMNLYSKILAWPKVSKTNLTLKIYNASLGVLDT